MPSQPPALYAAQNVYIFPCCPVISSPEIGVILAAKHSDSRTFGQSAENVTFDVVAWN